MQCALFATKQMFDAGLRYSLAELEEVAAALLAAFPDARVWALQGELGGGKTTLVKALCEQLGVRQTPTSPSFTLINEYERPGGEAVYHLDAYRLREPAEAAELDVEAYFDSGAHCFVEWPERIAPMLPPETHLFCIQVAEAPSAPDVAAASAEAAEQPHADRPRVIKHLSLAELEFSPDA